MYINIKTYNLFVRMHQILLKYIYIIERFYYVYYNIYKIVVQLKLIVREDPRINFNDII